MEVTEESPPLAFLLDCPTQIKNSHTGAVAPTFGITVIEYLIIQF